MRAPNPYTLRKLEGARKLPPHTEPVAVANVGFHETYTHSVEQMLPQLGESLPVLVLIRSDLVLLCDGKSKRQEVIPTRYHELKALAHAAFGLQLALMANGDGPLAEVTANDLREKRSQILDVQKAADALVKTIASQTPTDLLRHTLSLVDRVLTDGVVHFKRLRDELRALAPLAVEVGRLAVGAELEQLDAVVKRWRTQLGEAR